ncbi:hypothetical protein B0T26DRAFT_734756 [Lasiosphaeria miniovina]|uniref:Tafazzin n=1 Tax=Lasiosphaeria miniovina TaxID=1954250 RepID=A0AA39ZQI6_9PEZI|nr:uncharacterized protein B0T26DRAFT_734756 [Lasiosphaeria miniovina]KAK0701806.1 hypothetical protein B0T26DRAFT_734756 [Lasiosphaeria miniovina]
MPKKRYHSKFTKPQSTAPASLSISGASSDHDSSPQQRRSVNELLSNLRRVRLSGATQAPALNVQPSVPPVIRDILHLPETPAPRPRRPARLGAGRLAPAGPAPPRSWLSPSAPLASPQDRTSFRPRDDRRPLPGAYCPGTGSLIDIALRRLALDWPFQKEYCHYYLYDLPTHLRLALITYLAAYTTEGVSLADLQAILLPPPADGEDATPVSPDSSSDQGQQQYLSPSIMNKDVHHLDLSRCLGRSLKLRELSGFLFPSSSPTSDEDFAGQTLDRWDAPEADAALVIPPALLPNLTHLSLALDLWLPRNVSWRHLLAFVSHCGPTLTHLSLAFWPEPTLTPNAKFTSVVSPQGRVVQYGGTGPYSHSLDNDWVEAVAVLRKLSKALYGLEYLDLTGCAVWSPALWDSADHDAVDWVGTWGKISTVILCSGYYLPDGSPREVLSDGEAGFVATVGEAARRLERHVRSKRAGQGRVFSVETGK